ncbi:hypothetical protein IGI82_001270 [Enterococcus sp. AZ067]|uniref:oligosaccharide flippase family protein n=1 Tax=Enterococcus sp. AZ067 TaxID=2774674 RepID=UPI003F2287AB
MRKILSNFFYQSIFQVTKLILPLITIPIVSNALGPSGIGVFNYTNSIAQYFVLIAGLGIGVYGNREIARVRDDRVKMSKCFWEIFWMSFIVSILSLLAYFTIVSFSEYRLYFYLQSLVIIAAVFDISWFFMGIEDFKKSSLSSIGAQVFSFLAILYFVKGPDDITTYIIIQGMNLIFTQLIMWLFIIKKIEFKTVKLKHMYYHFWPAMQFFIPKIAIILYTNMSKTLLGWLATTTDVGFYTNTLILNSILVTLVTTIDLVLLPKFSNLVAKGDSKSLLNVLTKSIHIQLFFTIPMMFGTILIVPQMVPWFFGEKFDFIIKTIPLVSPLTIIMPLGLAVGRQYLVPMNKIKVYNIAVLNGAAISIITNLIFIPIIGVYGAILAIVLAELFVSVTRVYAFIKETRFSFQKKYILKCIFASVLMLGITRILTQTMLNSFTTTFVQIIIGFTIYMIMTILMKCNPLMTVVKAIKNN